MEETVRGMVERHSCEVFATRYSLRLEWVSGEPYRQSGATTYSLRVELTAMEETTRAPMQMHVALSVTELTDFPAALDAALRLQLVEKSLATESQRPWTARMQRWVNAVRPFSRRAWPTTNH